MKNIFKVSILVLFIGFTSCATKNKATAEAVRDGSSYEKAIIVNSISEEYEYVRNDCKGCQMKGQSLNFKDKKPYDILTLVTPNGDEVLYYFDISSFFGK